MSRTREKPLKFNKSCSGATEEKCATMHKALALPEILQEIFRYLDIQSKGRVAQVSWLWNAVIQQPKFWSDMTVALSYNENNPTQYKITPLNLNYIRPTTRMTPTQPYSRSFPMIKKLIIREYGCIPSDKTISLIVQRFNNLVSLNISGNIWFRNNTSVSDSSMTLIVNRLKSLRHLDLSDCDCITDIGLATLCGWNGITTDGNVPTLNSLSLQGIYKLTDVVLKYLSIGQPSLQILNLSLMLPKYLPDYSYNIITDNVITDTGIAHLKHMKNLADLDLSKSLITKAGLKLLASGYSRLTSLTLDLCFLVDDEWGQTLASFTHLSKLSLCGTSIGDTVLQYLADGKGASTIDTLDLMFCYNLTDVAGQHLARMVNLRVLNLTGSPIGDACLIHLASMPASRIEILSFDRESHVTASVLNHLALLPRLRKLNVCNCKIGVSRWDRSLIFKRAKNLKMMRCPCLGLEYSPLMDLEIKLGFDQQLLSRPRLVYLTNEAN